MILNIEILSEDRLNKLNTKRLLALYKSVRSYINVGWADYYSNGNDVQNYKDKIKRILDKREHVETK